MHAPQPDPTPAPAPAPRDVAPREATRERPTSVSRLNDTVRAFIATWGSVWVEGEISAWNVRGGAVYGRLRDPDADASIPFRIWPSTRARLPAALAIGDRVVASVKSDFFARTGDFTVVVASMQPRGLGVRLEELERLRSRLRVEGLFAPGRKRPLPFLPRAVGLITGENSDAEKDVVRNAQLRWPDVDFRIRHAAVQGERCVPEVLAALAVLDADPDVQVIVIARGGGDPLQLLGFSDERLVRAVAAARTPIVSAIGHENDFPLLDDVADVRASTPTDAAKRVVPDVTAERAAIAQLRARMTTRLSLRIATDVAHLEQVRSRPALHSPQLIVADRERDVASLVGRGRDAVERRLAAAEHAARELRASLRALSPGATLGRGYAIVHTPEGAVVRDTVDAPAGTELRVALARGVLAARSQGSVDRIEVAAAPGDPGSAD